MATVNEIFTKAKDHLRAIAGDSVEIIKKSLDKIAFNLDENTQSVEESGSKTEKAIKHHEKSILSSLEDVRKAINEQEVAENVTIKNPEAITGDLKSGLEGIINTLKEEVKNFDKEVVVKNDLGQLATLFKSTKDKKAVVEKLDKVEKAIRDLTFPEIPDMTDKIEELIMAINGKDNKGVEKLLDQLVNRAERPFPVEMDVNLDPNLIENDRIRMVQDPEQVAQMSRIFKEGTGATEIIKAIEANSGSDLPDYDESIIDEADPNNIEITYKKNGSTVATKTIVISGTTTTITIT